MRRTYLYVMNNYALCIILSTHVKKTYILNVKNQTIINSSAFYLISNS